jgi:site-specific DNA-methyltransferase (adenine-specific)
MLSELPDNSVDAVVTDPPYGLSKHPNMEDVFECWDKGEDYLGGGSGFMGKDWDSFVPSPRIWKEIMRVLKPNGHILSFSGTRTFDLMVKAMEIAGNENDCRLTGYLSWVYGSGFPKSLNIGKTIDKKLGAKREVVSKKSGGVLSNDFRPGELENERNVAPIEITEASTSGAKLWEGYGTALKPAHEPIAVFTKGGGEPLSTDSLFYYVAKANKKERNYGCDELFWSIEKGGNGSLTKEEYEARNGEKVATGNCWATVKPLNLMRQLVRAVKKEGEKNVILDPFMGSGTTLMAAILEGCDYVGVDADKVAYKIASARVDYALNNDVEEKKPKKKKAKKSTKVSKAQIVGVKKFLEMGYSADKVAKMVGLTVEQVEAV